MARAAKIIHLSFFAALSAILFCLNMASTALAADFTIFFQTDARNNLSQISASNEVYESYHRALIDELTRMGFTVKMHSPDSRFGDRDIIVKAGLIQLDADLVIPSADLREAKSQVILAALKTASFSIKEDIHQINQQLDSSAISLARMLYARLSAMNWAELSFEKSIWQTEEKTLRLQLSGFSGCFKNYFLDTLETEFPGSVSISVIKEVSVGTSQYKFTTAAKTRFISKWIRALLAEQYLYEERDFELSGRDKFITLKLFPNVVPKGSFC